MKFGSNGGICFSSEKADEVTMTDNGIDDVLGLVDMPVPDVYSAELFGIRFRCRRRDHEAGPAGHHVLVDDRLYPA